MTSRKSVENKITLFHQTKDTLEMARALVWLFDHDTDVFDLADEREIALSDAFRRALEDPGERYSLLARVVRK